MWVGPHDKGGRRWAVLVVWTPRTDQSTIQQDRKREWERETGQQQHRQGDHINTHQPPQLKSLTLQPEETNKSILCFQFQKEKKERGEKKKKATIRGARSFSSDTNSSRKAWQDAVSQRADAASSSQNVSTEGTTWGIVALEGWRTSGRRSKQDEKDDENHVAAAAPISRWVLLLHSLFPARICHGSGGCLRSSS